MSIITQGYGASNLIVVQGYGAAIEPPTPSGGFVGSTRSYPLHRLIKSDREKLKKQRDIDIALALLMPDD